MTYYINEENTGLENSAQVQAMADMMKSDGHDVEATTTYGLINIVECPVADQIWMDYLESADSE